MFLDLLSTMGWQCVHSILGIHMHLVFKLLISISYNSLKIMLICGLHWHFSSVEAISPLKVLSFTHWLIEIYWNLWWCGFLLNDNWTETKKCNKCAINFSSVNMILSYHLLVQELFRETRDYPVTLDTVKRVKWNHACTQTWFISWFRWYIFIKIRDLSQFSSCDSL